MRSGCATLLASGVLAALAAAGCGGQGPGGDPAVPIPHTFDEINQQVLQTSCAGFRACHSAMGAAQAGKLDLTQDPYGALVGVTAVNDAAAHQGMKRVMPCNAPKSFLVMKLELATDRDQQYGARMPYNGDPLPQPVIDAIADWVSRGAPRDGTPAAGCSGN